MTVGSVEMTLSNNPHDQRMLALVRPATWTAAPTSDVYDLIAVGGGTGGLVAASGAGLLGARTALIEGDLLGGDCLVHGCVPSKALLHAAAVAHEVRHAQDWGIHATIEQIDFAQVMAKLRRIRADIARDDAAEVLAQRKVDVVFGRARFTGPDRLTVGDRELRFKRAVIATGAKPRMPDTPGLAEYAMTNEQVFDLDTLPRRLLIIGGGPIGCELGQAFARFGSQVTLIQRQSRLLPVDDPDAAAVLLDSVQADGVDVQLETEVVRVGPAREGYEATLQRAGVETQWTGDKILVAAGRVANTQDLGLDAAGVSYDRHGIAVDRWQRTSNRRIYAVGDVAQGPNFTHAAYAQGATSVYSALLPFVARTPRSPMSWVTFTDPEVAHVGLRWSELQALGDRIQTITLGMDHNDRARTDGDARGYGRLHIKRGTDKLLAATFVGRHAGELIGEIAVLMTANKGLTTILDTVHPYPTKSWLTMYLANEHSLQRLTPTVKTWLQRWFRWFVR